MPQLTCMLQCRVVIKGTGGSQDSIDYTFNAFDTFENVVFPFRAVMDTKFAVLAHFLPMSFVFNNENEPIDDSFRPQRVADYCIGLCDHLRKFPDAIEFQGMSFHLHANQVKGLDVGEFTKAVKRWILNNEPRTKYEFDMKMVEGMVEYKKEQLIEKEVR